MTALNRLTTAARRSAEHRRRVRRLRAELADFRTPAERTELETLLAAHGTTVEELLQNA